MKVEVAMNKSPDCVYVLVSEHQMFEFDDPKEFHVLGVYMNYLDAFIDMKSLFFSQKAIAIADGESFSDEDEWVGENRATFATLMPDQCSYKRIYTWKIRKARLH